MIYEQYGFVAIVLLLITVVLFGKMLREARSREVELNGQLCKTKIDLKSYEENNKRLLEIIQGLMLASESGSAQAAFRMASLVRKEIPGLPSAEQVGNKHKEDVLERGLP